jgi:hypothetical protein
MCARAIDAFVLRQPTASIRRVRLDNATDDDEPAVLIVGQAELGIDGGAIALVGASG